MPTAGKLMLALVAATVGIYAILSISYQGDSKAILEAIKSASQSLGSWAIPVFVLTHTVAISLCFPYAIIFEAAASFLFGFVRGIFCIFVAKVLGASLAFFLGRMLFRSSEGLSNFVRQNKYFNVISQGVARDGWKFVLLARFSPVPSYIINYGLAATNINFFIDFLLPTICGGLPMIIQNASIGSLTSAATQTGGASKNSGIMSYVFPVIGFSSGLLITWRIKKYASHGFDAETHHQEQELHETSSRNGPESEMITSPTPTLIHHGQSIHQRTTSSNRNGAIN